MLHTVFVIPNRNGELGGDREEAGQPVYGPRGNVSAGVGGSIGNAARQQLALAQAMAAHQGAVSGSTRKRLVALSGTATFNQNFGNAETIVRDQIKQTLKADNFDVVNVRVKKESYISNDISIHIECNAYDIYSAEQVRQRAEQLLSQMTRYVGTSYLSYYTLTNVSLKVVSDFQTTIAGGSADGNNNNNNGSDPLSDFLTTFAASLGVSTAVAGAGLLIFAAVVLKR
jgi:hypothetical protein